MAEFSGDGQLASTNSITVGTRERAHGAIAQCAPASTADLAGHLGSSRVNDIGVCTLEESEHVWGRRRAVCSKRLKSRQKQASRISYITAAEIGHVNALCRCCHQSWRAVTTSRGAAARHKRLSWCVERGYWDRVKFCWGDEVEVGG